MKKITLLTVASLATLFCMAQTDTIKYTGTVQTYTVATCITSITVDVRGGQGGGAEGYANCDNITFVGGNGGRVQGTFPVSPGDVLSVYTGGSGANDYGSPGTFAGGWNGGGSGYSGGGGYYCGGSGGGASDIRLNGVALANRIFVAGGGGGSGNDGCVCSPHHSAGGAGGGLTGANAEVGNGCYIIYGSGGTPSSGGAASSGPWAGNASPGALGTGGNGCSAGGNLNGGGGGGGYYGGGGGGTGGGGGGSSYTAAGATGVVHTQGYQSGNGLVIITFNKGAGFITLTTTHTNLSCYGGNNGSASVVATGGSTPYTYKWTPNGGSNATANNLTAGNYTITVTDPCNDMATASVTLTQPTMLKDSVWSANSSLCDGACTNISLISSGGTPGYSYMWSNGQTTTSISDCPVTTTTYVSTVTDNNGCISMDSVKVFVNPLPTVTLSAANSSACLNTMTDALTGNPPGGSFTGQGVTGSNFNPNTAGTGTHTVVYTYTDINGCTSSDSIMITVNTLPSVTLSAAKDTNCVTITTDALTGSPAGGSFSGSGVTGSNFNPKLAGVGSHIIVYTYSDVNGCSNKDSIKLVVNACTGINELNALSDEVKLYPNPFTQNLNIENSINGTVTINIFNTLGENVGSYTMQSGQNIINTSALPAGVYMLQVKTENGTFNKKLVKVE